jgi:hypothetical protein
MTFGAIWENGRRAASALSHMSSPPMVIRLASDLSGKMPKAETSLVRRSDPTMRWLSLFPVVQPMGLYFDAIVKPKTRRAKPRRKVGIWFLWRRYHHESPISKRADPERLGGPLAQASAAPLTYVISTNLG